MQKPYLRTYDLRLSANLARSSLNGGGGGIRTLDNLAAILVFEAVFRHKLQ